MTALQTPQEFVSAVRQSGLVDPARLRTFVAVVRDMPPLTARRLADRAVNSGLLTRFQADEVLDGRARELTLGDYRLLARLGEGGVGGVFLAEHTPSGERRAVKLLHGELAHDPVAHDRLSREGAAIARLCHPNLVRVFEYDPGCTNRPPLLAMEYVDGVSLQAAVALAGTFTAEAAAECGRQAALALQHAWDAGLVHRDVKPANLLLAREGLVKVLDFGMVRLSGRRTVSDGRSLLGTAEYVAPEQVANGGAVDCRADVYALGGTIYFLLAGHPPFQHAAWPDRLRGKVAANPPPIHRLRPDVSESLSAIIASALAHRPDDRPPTPADLARQLARWADPNFGDDLFDRLDRAEMDTPPEGLPVTPCPVQAAHRPEDSTCEFPTPLALVDADVQSTLRLSRPELAKPAPPPPRSIPWWPILAGIGLFVVGVALSIAILKGG